ncbi:MAG: DUF4166 domain-containing protein [Hyphomicrobiaceae bacterium]|nr:DUF4166 domain-containing protein [Hyphomicrobiaceae bacterium]
MTALYRRALGARFADLAPAVQHLHDLGTRATWEGEADVERGTHPLSRLAGWLASLPPAGTAVPLQVTFEPVRGGEIWSRRFGRSLFRTRQFLRDGVLCERAGPITFAFSIAVAEGAMSLRLAGMRVLGIPVPRTLRPAIETREEQTPDGAYRFAVSSRLPGVGLLVAYRGRLRPA